MTDLEAKLLLALDIKNEKIKADNIRVGVSMFGVDGDYTSGATATPRDIANGKTAFVNGERITGVAEINGEPITYAELFAKADEIYNPGITDDSDTAEFTERSEKVCIARAIEILEGVV